MTSEEFEYAAHIVYATFMLFLELKIYVKSAIQVDSKSENCGQMCEGSSILHLFINLHVLHIPDRTFNLSKTLSTMF